METRKPRRVLVLEDKSGIDFTGPPWQSNDVGEQSRDFKLAPGLKTSLPCS